MKKNYPTIKKRMKNIIASVTLVLITGPLSTSNESIQTYKLFGHPSPFEIMKRVKKADKTLSKFD
jgi:hypothetical protein